MLLSLLPIILCFFRSGLNTKEFPHKILLFIVYIRNLNSIGFNLVKHVIMLDI